MKIKITDIYKKDAHYPFKDSLIGSTGDLKFCEHSWGGWYALDVVNQSYVGAKEHSGYGREGDRTFYGYAKYEVVEE
jgi:hypothetical protein